MIPKPLYELLPYGYIVLGLVSIISLENRWGNLSGLILIVAGIVIHQLRARHRTHNELFHKINHGRPTQSELHGAVEPRSRRSMPEPASRRSMPEPVSRRSMPEPRSVRTDRPSRRV